MEQETNNRRNARAARWIRHGLLLGGGDVLVLFLALLLGRSVVAWMAGAPLSLRFSLFLLPVWLAGAAAVGLLPAWGLDTVEELRRIQILLLSIFALGGVAYLFGRGVFYPSRLAYALSWLIGAAGIPALRAAIKRGMISAGAWGCPTVLYGDRAFIERTAAALRDRPELGYLPVGAFLDPAAPGGSVAGLPVLGGLRDAAPHAEVALAPMPLATRGPPEEWFDRALAGYRRALLIPESHEDVFLWVRPRSLGRMIAMEVNSNLFNPASRAIKRAADLALVSVAAPLWVPVLALLSLGIRFADGRPVFFVQTRIGRAGHPFRTVKFRTMRQRSEGALAEALARDPAARSEWEASRKLRRDPRVTPLGRWLRRWSLDELPQLVHVLSGRMSLVGPRPLPEDHDRELGGTVLALRRRVRPGITGLWQISGRSESGTGGMERWDAYYVRNWSVWLDLVILARTARTVFTGRGAY